MRHATQRESSHIFYCVTHVKVSKETRLRASRRVGTRGDITYVDICDVRCITNLIRVHRTPYTTCTRYRELGTRGPHATTQFRSVPKRVPRPRCLPSSSIGPLRRVQAERPSRPSLSLAWGRMIAECHAHGECVGTDICVGVRALPPAAHRRACRQPPRASETSSAQQHTQRQQERPRCATHPTLRPFACGLRAASRSPHGHASPFLNLRSPSPRMGHLARLRPCPVLKLPC
jgi:hypothetical protein